MIVLGCDFLDMGPNIGGDSWVGEGWLNKISSLEIIADRTW